MDYLVLSPPVTTPSEPPSGAFLLASGLAARGIHAGFLDLSISFFRHVFHLRERFFPGSISRALAYLENNSTYDAHRHATASGVLNSVLREYSRKFTGWRITLMDAVPPVPIHAPERLSGLLGGGISPFTAFFEEYLVPVLRREKPSKVLVSLSYLSQLAAGIELVQLLRRFDTTVTVGGSLPNSLRRTGFGFDVLKTVLPEMVTGDGSDLLNNETRFLDELSWPQVIGDSRYVSGRPVIPWPLSTGCYWNRCLFCPDARGKLETYKPEILAKFLDSIPVETMKKVPLVHFLDSAVPPGILKKVLPLLRERGLDFFTFARPEPWLVESAPELADSGCLMLQLGVETGSDRLLKRFAKGTRSSVALEAIRACAASGIRTYVYMLLGLPGETPSDMELTVKLLEDAGDAVDFLNFSIFNLPEKCSITKNPDEFDIELLDVDTASIRLYRPFLHAGRNPRIYARKTIEKKFSSIPVVKKALQRTPNWFRASHFPLIVLPGRR